MPGVIKSKIYIPEQDITEECLRDNYEIEMFQESICARCPYKKDKPNEYCEACSAYEGILRLWAKNYIQGKAYYTIPSGNIKRASKLTGIDFSDYKDLRCIKPFDSDLHWIGQLRQGEVVNGVQSANQQLLVDTWLSEEKRYGFVQAPPRTGKCLTGESIINVSKGFLHLNELGIKDGIDPSFIDYTSTMYGSEKVLGSFSTEAKTLKIITKDGLEISGTEEHPLLVINSDLSFSWKCLKDIEIGDHIVGNPLHKDIIFGNSSNINKIEAKYLGWMTANGRYESLSSSDEFVIKQFIDNSSILGGISRIEDAKKVKSLHLRRQGLKRLESLGYKTGSRNKDIPLSVRTASKEIITEFLTGYFECDSANNGQYIELSSASERLIYQLQILLQQIYDIRSVRFSKQKSATNSRNPKERTYWILHITGRDANLFCQIFPTSKVNRNYGHLWTRKSYSSQECLNKKYIPYLLKFLADLYDKTLVGVSCGNGRVKTYSGEIIKSHMPIQRYDCTSSDLTLSRLSSIDWNTWIETVLKIWDLESYQKVKRILDLSWTYHKVISKSDNGIQRVYDITVPEGHNFIANTLVSHNTVCANYISMQIGYKTLIIAHQHELLENFMKSLKRDTNLLELQEQTGKEIAKILEKKKDLGKEDYDILMFTYQSFIREASDEDFKKYIQGHYGLVIIDEAHQAGAAAYAKFLGKLDCRYRLGMSATPLRKDALNFVLLNIIGPTTVKSQSTGLIPRIEILETGIKSKYSYALFVKAYQFLQREEKRNKLILKEVIKDLKNHKCIIIPVDSKAHMKALVDSINQYFMDEIAIGYHSGVINRKNILNEIDSGKYRVVVAIKSMIKQGIDLLSPSMIYIQIGMSAAPQPKGSPMFYQMGNRVCTPYSGKPEPIVKIFIDEMPQSYGCFASLFSKEIKPGLIIPQNGKPRYKMSKKAYDYASSIVKKIGMKIYKQSGKFNPDTDEKSEDSEGIKNPKQLLSGSWL